MVRLYWFNLKQTLRVRETMFWALAFPLLLATFFNMSFGSSRNTQTMQAVHVALTGSGNAIFEAFLGELDGETLLVQRMEEEQARKSLETGEIEGIFCSGEEPSLLVAGSGISESILEMLLQGYLENERMMRAIGEKNPLQLVKAAGVLSGYQNYVRGTTLDGNELNDNLDYFFSLIAMACLFGCFMGMTTAMGLRADQSPLAARQTIVPTGRLQMVISGMLATFTVQFFNICLLLLYLHFGLGISFGEKWPLLLPVCALGCVTGVTIGMLMGTLHLSEGLKSGLLVSSSLILSFLSGLMFGGMKNVVEKYAPVVNRLNPAALISDAFYSITVYENPGRYAGNLAILALISAVLLAAAFLKLRRERYDSL